MNNGRKSLSMLPLLALTALAASSPATFAPMAPYYNPGRTKGRALRVREKGICRYYSPFSILLRDATYRKAAERIKAVQA